MRNDASKNKKAPQGMLARIAKAAKSMVSKSGAKASPKGGPKPSVSPSPKAPTSAAKGKPTTPPSKASPAVKLTPGAEAVAPAPRRTAKARVAAGLKDSSICREVACESLATTTTYCRLHYIKNWKKIRLKEQILSEGKLNQFIDELVGKYPEKYIEAIRVDLANDKDFIKVVADLELAEPAEEFETGAAEAEGAEEVLIDSIRRDFDEDSEAF